MSRLVCLSFALLSLWTSERASAACVAGDSRRVSRFPVVMKAPAQLSGVRASRLEAWSYRQQKWTSVPIQVDEVNAEDNYVLDEGQPYTKFTDDGLLDSKDEISVKGSDLGDAPPRSGKNKWPPGFKRGLQVDFCDSANAWYGSMIIGIGSAGADTATWRALFDKSADEVVTDSYRYRFLKDQPMLMGHVYLKNEKKEVSLFDSHSFIMPLIPKWGLLPNLYFSERDFTSEIECWRSGPVRSIVAVGARLKKFFSLIDLHLFSELVFYEDYFQIPTKIEFIFDPSKYLGKGTGLAYVLSFPPDHVWDLSSNLVPLPEGGPGDPSLNMLAVNVSENGQFAVTGHSQLGSFKANVRVDQKALALAPPPFVLNKSSFGSPSIQKNWPWVRKVQGQLGVFIEISGVKQGLYDFALDVAMSNQAHDEFTDFRTLTAYWSGDSAL